MHSQEIIVGLDIGTTKICVIVGKKNEFGKIEVLGMGKTDSLGVNRGVVRNINDTTEAIKIAVAEAEAKSGVEIHEVYVGIAGQHIKSLQHRGLRVREDGEEEITYEDIDKMIEDMHKLALPPGEKIIHVLPEEFIVDGEAEIKSPVGMCGSRLEANFHVITGQILHIQNIYRCVQKAGLAVADLILEPIASASAALSEEEKEAGIAMVDIGGGTSDVAIFQDGILRHTAVIPLGGNIITEDIKEGCMIMKKQAELLKVRFGSALALDQHENEIVSIPGLRGREPKEISIKNLAHIIQARVEEMMEHMAYEIKCSGYEKKLIGGIVVTGGGAQLRYINHLTQFVTGTDARTGYPTEHLADTPLEDLKMPMYSTAIGLIVVGFNELERKALSKGGLKAEISDNSSAPKFEEKMTFLKSWLKKGKEWLEEEDVDFND